MNKIIEQSEMDFRISMMKMSHQERSSLLKFLEREIEETQRELIKSQSLLKISKENSRNLEVFRYEQTIRDIEMEVEKLERKKDLCQPQAQGTICNGAKTQNGSSSITPTPSRVSPTQQNNNNNVLPLSTKRVVNSFVKKNDTDPHNPSNSKQNKFPSLSSHSEDFQSHCSLPTNFKLKNRSQSVQSIEPLFAQIKLKKVGLPPDAQEYDQNNFSIAKSDKTDSAEKTAVQYKSTRSPSVDCIKSNDLMGRDKFYNPNKDIQVAIQNEIKEIRLKKTGLSSPPLNCAVEQVNMGKFNFSNERNLSSNSSTPTPLSASKSMPFLSSIASLSMVFDDSISSPSSQLIPIEENAMPADDVDGRESLLVNWDPSVILKSLYTIQKKSNWSSPSKRSNEKFSTHVDFILGPDNGRSWQRGYISISNGHLNFQKNEASITATDIVDLRHVSAKLVHNNCVEIRDSKGIHSTIRCLKSSDCHQLLASLQLKESKKNNEIVPHLYDTIKDYHSHKVLIVDLGSCSVRAGLLKDEPTLPGLYFPHVAAISKSSNDVLEVGFEAFDPSLIATCDIIRPLKPDTTFEHLAFTSGAMEATVTKICSSFGINPREYTVMLSLPHNVAETARSKLADVLLLRLNFKGVSMCGESLLALHAYGEPTGVLVDIGYRTEILAVTEGVVQNAAVKRGVFGGHLVQVALSHLLPFELHSITDFLLVRLIMEETCLVAGNSDEAHHFKECANIDLKQYKLPSHIPSSLNVQGKDRCLPVEGLFYPEIYSIDTCGLADMIRNSIQSCPMDFRKDLYRTVYLSGATSQVHGLPERLESELRRGLSSNCEVKVSAAPDRAHFSYVGACFVASSGSFAGMVVSRAQWEHDRLASLGKWPF